MLHKQTQIKTLSKILFFVFFKCFWSIYFTLENGKIENKEEKV